MNTGRENSYYETQCAHDQHGQTLVPAVDVYENSKEFVVFADMPGVPHDQLSVEVEGDTLNIEGKITLGHKEGDTCIYSETRATRFSRSFRMSRDLDVSQINAQLKNGVLKLKIPKVEGSRARKVEVVIN